MRNKSILPAIMLLPVVIFAFNIACAQKDARKATGPSLVKTISGIENYKKVIETSSNKLLLFDIYADWCMPCRILSPLLEEIAQESKGKAAIYKINADKDPEIAGALGVSGIPHVAFIKNKNSVYALTGVHPKQTYVRAINALTDSDAPDGASADTPDGEIIDGVRVIRLSTATSPNDIYVYRGETVKLIIERVDFAYSIHIPEYKISQEGVLEKDLEVTFKAEDIGVFPVLCNGACPSGDGARYGRIIVMQYAAGEKFREVSVDETKALIEKSKPLILDVRTPNEYYSGHIAGAKLIPVQQLESRWSEIEAYKDKEILVYCRSGNRSTVASQILVTHGFTKLSNLRQGVKGWAKEGGNLVK